MAFRVGQKVVCVDVAIDYLGRPTKLRENAIYTIGRIVSDYGMIGLVVEGAHSWHETGAYRSSRFRPVVERKTDISIFTRMLNPSKVGADA